MSIRTVLFAALISLTVAACGKDSKPADCSAVATALSKGLTKMSDGSRAKAVSGVVESCKRDGWSAESTGCFAAAKTDAEGKNCVRKLSGTQAAALKAAIQAAMESEG